VSELLHNLSRDRFSTRAECEERPHEHPWASSGGGGGDTFHMTVNVSGMVVGTQDQLAKQVQQALVDASKRGAISRDVLNF
jgi:hypothetical protein